jgi:hypothetical protein
MRSNEEVGREHARQAVLTEVSKHSVEAARILRQIKAGVFRPKGRFIVMHNDKGGIVAKKVE